MNKFDKEYYDNYREENKESIKKKTNEYYEANKEAIRKSQDEYRRKNIDKIREKARIRYQESKKGKVKKGKVKKVKKIVDRNPTEKTCKGCEETKLIIHFCKAKTMSDGHLNYCRPCENAKVRKRTGQNERGSGEHYVNNNELYYEIIVAKATGRLSIKAQNMLIKIADGVATKFRYNNDDDRHDCYGYGLEMMLTNFLGFNEEVTRNPFAYFTEICKRGMTFQFNKLTKMKGDPRGEAQTISLDYKVDGRSPFNL